jgi:hypothetical protein
MILDRILVPLCLAAAAWDIYQANLGVRPGAAAFLAALLAFSAGFRVRGRFFRG